MEIYVYMALYVVYVAVVGVGFAKLVNKYVKYAEK